MDWDVVDFVVFGAMLAGVGIVYWLATRVTGNTAYRLAAGLALLAAFLLLWVNGAVGIIGDAGNDANMMFPVVPAVALIGALVARFRPAGMTRALAATALAQALVPLIAIAGQIDITEPVWTGDVLILTGLFVALWLISAWLFRKTARKQAATAP